MIKKIIKTLLVLLAIVYSSSLIGQNSQPVYNVYIENSGSMYGYVKGVTSFENTIYQYLSDLTNKNVASSLNFNYINNKTTKISSIKDFILDAEPSSMMNKGGNAGSTDISNIFNTVFSLYKDNEVSIIISDYIFSPGSGKKATEYLSQQSTSIYNTFSAQLIKHPNTSVLFYRLESDFDGPFYDENNLKYNFKGNRPYYIMIIGNNKNLIDLRKKCPETSFGVKNMFSISGEKKINYAIKNNSGQFTLKKQDPKKSIIEAKKTTKGNTNKLTIAIDVDYSNILLDEAYILNKNNYSINNSAFSIDNISLNNSNVNYNHTIRISSPQVFPVTLTISLNSILPSWIEEYTDNDGGNLTASNKNKTFGLKYLAAAISKAYANYNKNYTSISININK